MKIIEKIQEKQKDLYSRKPITIVFLGDSVTQGCFECFEPYPDGIETIFKPEDAYCERVKAILNMLYPIVPITIINAGISGGSAQTGLNRIDRDVISYKPDLCVVCFGLNDSGNGEEYIPTFKERLSEIFKKLQDNDIEVLLLTPNTMNFNVSPHIQKGFFTRLAESFSKRSQNGLMDKYVEVSKEEAMKNNIKICDCYSVWKNMQQNGVNVTELLANKLNHPIKEMHWMFAYEIVKCFMEK